LELETDKATIEVPSSADGVIKEIKVKAGEKVKVGQTIFTVDEAAAPSKNGGTAAAPAKEAAPAAAKPAAAPEPAAKPAAAPEPAKAAQPPAEPKRKAEVVEMKAKQAPSAPAAAASAAPAQAASAPTADASSIPAAPSARRLARELGINIAEIRGSGAGGRISTDDVTAHARRLLSGGAGVGRA